MGRKYNVLVFPAGEINSIELHNSLSTCVNINLYGASSVDRHGPYVFENYISGIPVIKDEGFISEMNRLIEEYGIDIVIPTHDDVALYLAENREKFETVIMTPDYATNLICRDKAETFKRFKGESFCPEIYNEVAHFPVFVKPRRGQGAQGARVINNQTEFNTVEVSDYVVCEYLPGNELTVDCFSDKDGKLQAVLPRTRDRVLGGTSVKSVSVELTDEIERIAETINSSLNLKGLWYFQIKQDVAGRYKLLEISTRCAGTMCLSRARGVNLPLLSVYAYMGLDTTVSMNEYSVTVDRTLINRYRTGIDYSHVYIDLDDTIIIDRKVYLPAIWYLYQCRNKGIRISLITRHSMDHPDSVEQVLADYRISIELFDEIIELPFDKGKYTAISDNNAIFIDNAFAERKEVSDRKHIPVFDVDGIEVLMDWRK